MIIWSILGFSVGILAIICLSLAEFVVEHDFFQVHRFNIAMTVGLLGLATTLWGRRRALRRIRLQVEEGGDPAEAKVPFLNDLQYWGILLLVLAGIVPFVRPLKNLPKVQPPSSITKAVPVRKKATAPTNAPAPPRPPPRFPEAKLGGIIFDPPKSTAILNGRPYCLGDRLGDAQIVAITREAVALALDGKTNVLSFGK